MVCSHCGADSPKNKNFCVECGKEIKKNKLVGYSTKINDPAFKKYIKDTKTWSLLFAVILSLIVTISFYIYGETSNEMENPEALFIGLIISAMFIVIALIQVISINKTKTFDGVVIDKKIEEHSRRRHTANNDYYIEEYLVYYVLIKADNNTTDIHLISGKLISGFKTWKHYESQLPSSFFRIHNSYIVNLNHVSRINTGKSDCYLLDNTIKIPFSRTYKEQIDLIIKRLG